MGEKNTVFASSIYKRHSSEGNPPWIFNYKTIFYITLQQKKNYCYKQEGGREANLLLELQLKKWHNKRRRSEKKKGGEKPPVFKANFLMVNWVRNIADTLGLIWWIFLYEPIQSAPPKPIGET